MTTKIIDFDRITKQQFKEIIRAVKSGAVIICPTDTIYGISGIAGSRKIIKKICRIKKRGRKKSFIILTHSVESAKKLTHFNKNAKKLAEKFWPGPLTMVLPTRTPVGRAGHYGKKIAVRIPSNKKLLKLLKSIRLPLISTSANLSEKPYINKKTELMKNFHGIVDYILHGKLKPSLPSTIVDTTSKRVKILRQGPVSKEKILACL